MKTMRHELSLNTRRRSSPRTLRPVIARSQAISGGFLTRGSAPDARALSWYQTTDWMNSEWFRRWEELAYGSLARDS
jgi:hypothetical protein